MTQHNEAALRAALGEILNRHGASHAGIALGIVRPEGRIVLSVGRASVDRVDAPNADTVFEIGSITKVFTALVLADMVEERIVALDDPVQRFLPQLTMPVRSRPITLGDLATHTSGLPRLPKGSLWIGLRHRENPYVAFTPAHLDRAICETRRRSPGGRPRYSNFGFGLLGHVLALQSGTSYAQLVHDRVCQPIGLGDTSIGLEPEDLSRFADGHNRKGRTVPHWDLPTLPGAGALRSTVTDMLRFAQFQLDPPETRLGRAVSATQEIRAKRGPFGQGLGWMSLPVRGLHQDVLWHNGGTGGFRSYIGLVTATGSAVVVLSNCTRGVDRIGQEALLAMHHDAT